MNIPLHKKHHHENFTVNKVSGEVYQNTKPKKLNIKLIRDNQLIY